MESNSTHDDIFLQAMKKEEEEIGEENGSPLRSGKVVEIGETDVFLDMGSKAEVLVALDEFDVPPQIGDELLVVLKDMKDGVKRASKKGAERIALTNDIKKAYHEGLPVKGTIKKLIKKDDSPKGYSVDLGAGIEAFVPLSHIDTRKVTELEELIGTSVDLAVIDMRRNSFTVSQKEYRKKTVKKLYGVFFENHSVGDVVNGAVDEIDQNFLILNVEGIKAFLHISDFSWKYLTDLKKVVKIGDKLEVKIIQMEKARDSVKVGKKQLMPDPWETIEDKLNLGDVVDGKVVRFKKDRALIELEDGIEASLHVSEMSWTQKVRDPRKLFKRGMMVNVKIVNIEPENRRIDVSLRETLENPWENARDKYTIGRKLKGHVTSILDFGVFVKFDDGIEGLLRREDVDWLTDQIDLKAKFEKDQELEVVVLSLDDRKEKLGLGIKQLSGNPYETFQMNYPRNSVVEAKVKSILDNGVTIELQDNLDGFIHISNLDKKNVDNVSDFISVGDTVKAVVKYIDIPKKRIELSRKDFQNMEERAEVDKYMSNKSSDSQTISFGSLLKDKLDNIKTVDAKSEKKKEEPKPKKEEKAEVKKEEKVEPQIEETEPKKEKETKSETVEAEPETEETAETEISVEPETDEPAELDTDKETE